METDRDAQCERIPLHEAHKYAQYIVFVSCPNFLLVHVHCEFSLWKRRKALVIVWRFVKWYVVNGFWYWANVICFAMVCPNESIPFFRLFFYFPSFVFISSQENIQCACFAHGSLNSFITIFVRNVDRWVPLNNTFTISNDPFSVFPSRLKLKYVESRCVALSPITFTIILADLHLEKIQTCSQ